MPLDNRNPSRTGVRWECSAYEKKKRPERQKGQSFVSELGEGLHDAPGSKELKCPVLLGADVQVKQTELE